MNWIIVVAVYILGFVIFLICWSRNQRANERWEKHIEDELEEERNE